MPQKATARRRPAATEPAPDRPVARVAVDVSLAHLDRPFDYLVPARVDEVAVPGCRVRVRFAGQLLDGFVLDRVDSSDHHGSLTALSRVVSGERVLTPEIAGLAREVADRYAGTLPDVLRLAVPPRHAAVEAEPPAEAAPVPSPPQPGPWSAYPAGPALLAALARGDAPRAVWTAMPGEDWPDTIARAARATLSGGRDVLVVAPDGRDVARLDAALTGLLGDEQHTVLTADLGPAERYRRWLRALRGSVRAVVGTRAAMFAPLADLGLVVVWDDGDALHAEPRAPHPHVREVLGLRAHRLGSAAVFGGFSRTPETARLVETGWARSLTAPRSVVRRAAPRIRPAGEDAELARDPAARSARLPTLAHRAARDALETGPVLVQVPRRGYLPAVACVGCRQQALCRRCCGPLGLTAAGAAPHCRWCGAVAGGWGCRACGSSRVRAVAVGARRTAEELGRSFPSVPVRTSGREEVLERVGSEAALVVATPGAEPAAEDGYAAALLLDGSAMVARPGLRAAEEALRRWLGAATLVRPASSGGRVVVLADGGLAPVQALLRWDPASYAEDELAERAQLGFPPAVRMASLTGRRTDLDDMLTLVELPEKAETLGPVQVEGSDEERALVRVPRDRGAALAKALRDAQGRRSARRSAGGVRVRMDPPEPL